MSARYVAAGIVAGVAALAFTMYVGRRPGVVRKYLQRAHCAVAPMLNRALGRFKEPPVALKGAPQSRITVEPARYPEVRRGDTVDTLASGARMPDPYRWLEDPDAPETVAFVEAQNALTDGVLAECATRARFKELMTALYNYPRFSCPFKRGDRYYYTHNSGLQAQSVIYTQAALDAEPEVFLDPNTFSADGTVALDSFVFSEDGSLLAYSTGSGGSDWRTIHLMRVDATTGKPTKLEDELKYVKFSSMAWTHDGKGFFYNRYAPPATAELGTETDTNKDQQLWYHLVGTPQSADKWVYAVPEHPDWFIGAEVTDDGRYLLLSLSAGCEPANRLYWLDLAALPHNAAGAPDFTLYDRAAPGGVRPLPLQALVDDFAAQWEYVANEGTALTLKTNLNAPRYRIVRTDLQTTDPPARWPDVVPQHPQDLLQWAAALQGDVLVTCYLHDVAARMQLRSLASGGLAQEIPLPGLGSIRGFSGRQRDSELFFNYTDFLSPGSIFRLDTAAASSAAPQLFRQTQLSVDFYDASAFETQQAFVASADGTQVPLFIVARKGIPLDGSNPTLLYGYGGFNISLEPGFLVSRLAWMLAYGGVYAMANLRGGGEYGLAWRAGGSLHNKQNVFDDFVACAEHLVREGYTQPAKLAIQGGSNGGLLVAACTNQRPDLFGAVLAQVGVMDMLRFHLFTIGHAWISDYGDPDSSEDLPYLLAYSPLHNVRPPADGGGYPAMLLLTGDHDDRVVPLHSLKLLATLQHELRAVQRNPLLARIEVRAGHGAGKPTDKIIAEAADMYAFAAEVLGAQWAHL